jgi:hypothetical protein
MPLIPDDEEARALLASLSNQAAAEHWGCSVPTVRAARRRWSIPAPPSGQPRDGGRFAAEGEKLVMLGVRLPGAVRRRLNAVAAREGTTAAEIARRLIVAGLGPA